MCGVGILRTTAVHQEVPEDDVELSWALSSTKDQLNSCIVWVTTEEAFLECVRNGRRTSVSSGPSAAYEGYGQWTVS